MVFEKEMAETKAELDNISHSFCIAKWNQVTLHLESGFNHSCHHPKPHRISENELKKTVAALHNTSQKLKVKKEMLEGRRPAECEYCWKVENLRREELYSDRILKSSDPWARPFLGEILQNPLDGEFLPRYLEVSFSNACNLKCSYCSANYSSSWMKELKEKGNYSTLTGKRTQRIFAEAENPFIKAFWDWWPRLGKNLRVLRITGGEPLLSENTFRLLAELEANPNPDLDLAVNSNLAVPQPVLHKFIQKIRSLEKKRAVRKIDFYTSMEAAGSKAEYIRFGLKYPLFVDNLRKLLEECPSLSVTIMSTFNALSVCSYRDLLKSVLQWNLEHSHESRRRAVRLDISYLREPRYQSVEILPPRFKPYFDEIQEFLQKNSRKITGNPCGFEDDEILKFQRVYQLFLNAGDRRYHKDLKRMFFIFFTEHDNRRGTDFLKTFPDFHGFWGECQQLMPLGKNSPLVRRALFESYRARKRILEFPALFS